MRLVKTIVVSFSLAVLAAGVAKQAAAQGQTSQAAGDSGAAATQQTPAAPSPAATLQVYSRLTVVDVTVTDAKGQPVRGLKQSDFTLKEDGKPQPIRSFQEVGQDTPVAQRTPPKLPPNVYTNIQPPPATSAVNILLIDALNTLPLDQAAVKQEALKYLKSMPRGTRIAVLGLSSSLRVLQGFTSDPGLLAAVLESKKSRVWPSPFSDTDISDTLDSQINDATDNGPPEALTQDGIAAVLSQFQNEQQSFQTDLRNRMTLEALNQIAAYVAGIKGRKNLIWFTDGLPLNIFPTNGTNDLEGMTDYAKDLRKTTDLLTAAEVAVYPVDARALFNNPALGADQHLDTINKNTGATVAANDMAFRQKKGQELLSMDAVAEATGGIAYYNTNGLKEAVGKAVDNGSNYYGLSYVPPDLRYDGRYHSIDVEVDQPDVHLGYRKGYNADNIANNEITPGLTLAAAAPEPYGTNMDASMARGVPTSGQVLFDVRVTPSTDPPRPNDPPLIGELDPKLKGKPLVRYALQYLLPVRQITFTSDATGAHKGMLQFEVAAYDLYGKLITKLSQTVNIQLTADQYQQFLKKPFQPFQQIDLPHGEMFLRIGILDGVSDKVGTLELPLLVMKKPAAPTGQPGGTGGN